MLAALVLVSRHASPIPSPKDAGIHNALADGPRQQRLLAQFPITRHDPTVVGQSGVPDRLHLLEDVVVGRQSLRGRDDGKVIPQHLFGRKGTVTEFTIKDNDDIGITGLDVLQSINQQCLSLCDATMAHEIVTVDKPCRVSTNDCE